MNKNNLRKKLSYDGVIKKYEKFNIPIPNRKATDIMNHPIITNLLSHDSFIDERRNYILKFDKFTQTPYEQFTQTDILDKEAQEDYKLQHHDLYPHLYHKIDAMSKPMQHDTNIVIKNNSTSENIGENNNINQTSQYIPNSLKQKKDNINQTVRYILRDISPQNSSSGDYQEWYDSLRRREPSIESLPELEPHNNTGFLNWLINLTSPGPPQSDPSVPPSVPSPSIQSPSESPMSYIPPSPPSSPSQVAYPASVSSSSSSGRSIKSGKKQK